MPDATYEYQKKYPCDPGTRKEILADIMEWTTDISNTARCFFWMSGDPGVGKSAITASIAKESKRRKVLWAQLFINRNDARTIDPRFFFPSIAQQMSKSSLAVEHAVQETLREQPELMNEDISIDQGKKLFVNTIRIASQSTPTSPVVIVIDALDETDIKRLATTVAVLSEVLLDLPRNAKVFISSRAEEVIRNVFGPQLTHTRVRHMHLSTKDSIPEVTAYLERRVAEIMNEYCIDLSQWGEERMRKLCEQASGLFIWAVTAIEYIRAEIKEDGKECLGVVLDQLNADGMENVNMLYLTILNQTYRRENGPWRYQRFQRIMGAILVQQSPLCIADIEGLLDLQNPVTHKPADVEHFVRRLRTVLVAGAGEINRRTVPRVHRSFSDFVTSAGAEDFRVDKTDSDGELAIQCIRQLNQLGVDARQGLQEIPAQLPYAISHWSSHLTRMVGVKMEQLDRDDESMSTPDAIDLVLDPDMNPGAEVGVEVTKKRTGDSIYLCIAFSPDGTRMAITQDESIRLRNIQTGEEVSWSGHTDAVCFVAFSPDGKRIVSASDDATICIWNSDTGEMVLGPLEGHTDTVRSALFSPDGRRIVSASDDATIRIWNSDTGEMVSGPLKGHTSGLWSAVFSPDGRLIVSTSEDNTIRVWDSQSGNMALGPLEGNAYLAVFSADSRHIVSHSGDRTILIWDCDTGEIVRDSHESDDTKLSFTNSETVPYIITPPHSNIRTSGTSSSSYSFSLERGVVAGVVDADIDTWLYVATTDSKLEFLMWRYAGQLILNI
jgi:WD domain, G-beta repeat/WD40-like Beta Propeller Repeat